MRHALLLAVGLLGVAVLALLSGGQMAIRSASPASAAGPVTIGIDFNTTDNTATSVGSISTCWQVASGASYTLDVYVQNVPGDTDITTPDGMVAGQYTLNSISGNTDTARTATAGFIDTGTGIAVSGSGAVDNTASTPVNNSTGSDTIVASNDPAIGSSGAVGDGFFIRMTYTAPVVGTVTIVPLTLTAVTLVDANANEISSFPPAPTPAGVVKDATLIIAPDGTTNCVNFLATPTPVFVDTDGDSLGLTGVFWTGVCQSGGNMAPRFNDCLENFVGTDPLRACAATVTANDEPVDAMPADLNDDRSVNVRDRALMVLAYNGGTYNKRYDLNADGAININDRTIVAFLIKITGGVACTP